MATNTPELESVGAATVAPTNGADKTGSAWKSLFTALLWTSGGTLAITVALLGLAWQVVDHDTSHGGMQGLIFLAIPWFGVVIVYPLLGLITLAKGPGPFRGLVAGVVLPPLLIIGGAWLYFSVLNPVTLAG